MERHLADVISNRDSSTRSVRLFSVSISGVRVLVYIVYCGCLWSTFPIVAGNLADPGFFTSLVLAYVLGSFVPVCTVLGRRLDLLEPIYWFSAKYYLVFPAAVYFLVTGFAYSEQLINPGLLRLEKLTSRALILFILGYAGYLAGYVVLMRDRGGLRALKLPSVSAFSAWMARTLILVCVLIGTANFFYLAFSYPGGAARYLIDFGQRSNRFSEIAAPVTTFGYQFLYAGVLLWFIVLYRDKGAPFRRVEHWAFYGVSLFSLFVSISQGRLTQSISYLLILGFMAYVFSSRPTKNARFLLLSGLGLLGGVVLYFLRRVSAGTFGNIDAPGVSALLQYAKTFLPALGYWIIDKGNVPNLAVVVNLLSQDGLGGEYWYGGSFIVALTKLSSLLGDLPNIGETASRLWFHVDGGLPPTIVGEMFVNFGYVGVPGGLFAVGLLCSRFYGFVAARGHCLWYIIYLAVLFKFIFLWPKGEASNLVGAFWQFAPAVCVFWVIRLLSAPGTIWEAAHEKRSRITV